MREHRIGWLPGDGIGPEVSQAARTVLDAVGLHASYFPGDVGWSCWEQEGNPLPERTIEMLRDVDCAFFGAITSKPLVAGYRSPIITLRETFELYASVRPTRSLPTVTSGRNAGVDIVIFRENSEDLYMGLELEELSPEARKVPQLAGLPDDARVALRVITPTGCERIIRAALEYAVENRRQKVTCVHKANVMRVTDGMFLQAFRSLAQQYPSLDFEEANVDAVAMRLMREPQQFDVIVTTNLFGDILSDEVAELGGGLGFAASANLGESFAVFEPVHGSAPDLAGSGTANPCAAVLASALMLTWLGESDLAARVTEAVREVVRDGTTVTPDLGGHASTMEMAGAIAAAAS